MGILVDGMYELVPKNKRWPNVSNSQQWPERKKQGGGKAQRETLDDRLGGDRALLQGQFQKIAGQ
jgi:hypothetical protein